MRRTSFNRPQGRFLDGPNGRSTINLTPVDPNLYLGGHALILRRMLDGVNPVDFFDQGLDPGLAGFTNMNVGTAILMHYARLRRRSTPSGAYVISHTNLGKGTQHVGLATFEAEDLEADSLRSRVLSRLRNDTGVRYFTGWLRHRPEVATEVLDLAIEVAQAEGLNQIKVIQPVTTVKGPIMVVSNGIDLTSERFGFEDQGAGTAVIQGRQQSGLIFSRDLR